MASITSINQLRKSNSLYSAAPCFRYRAFRPSRINELHARVDTLLVACERLSAHDESAACHELLRMVAKLRKTQERMYNNKHRAAKRLADRPIERVPVQSRTIESIGYCPRRKLLDIEFKGGAVYQYSYVDRETYRDLMQAASKGIFFNAFIKGKVYFPCKRVA